MTAYASAEKTVDDIKATIEIRSYNSRHIDMFIRTPSSFQFMEDKLK